MRRETTKHGPLLDEALGRHLRPSVFPADRDQLVAEAVGDHAPVPVLEALRELRPGVEFATVHEVWTALRGATDVREDAARDPLSGGGR